MNTFVDDQAGRGAAGLRPRSVLLALATLVAATFLLVVVAAPADAANNGRPKAGGWKWKKTSTGWPAKNGSAKVSKGGKKLAKLSLKPGDSVATSCGSSKPIKLTKALPIQKLFLQWRVAKKISKTGYTGRPAKLKQGSSKYKGSISLTFTTPKQAIGLITTGVPGCYMYFNLKKK